MSWRAHRAWLPSLSSTALAGSRGSHAARLHKRSIIVTYRLQQVGDLARSLRSFSSFLLVISWARPSVTAQVFYSPPSCEPSATAEHDAARARNLLAGTTQPNMEPYLPRALRARTSLRRVWDQVWPLPTDAMLAAGWGQTCAR